MDSSGWNGIITSGGVVRNDQGDFIAAFSNFYGQGYNNVAEFKALLERLQLCRTLFISLVMIESDLTLVVAALKTGRVDNWPLQYIFRDCLDLFDNSCTITIPFAKRTKLLIT